ncbi:membrane protein [Cellulomonas aerilata]|uniref:Membrane protein n=1 Tax=Cellulomonas aerilata TaxID=515326 RepID=A0A512DAM2_9CELL|nr:membrane protein [Cellulomonas aerilata]
MTQVLVSAASNQTGAGLGAQAFDIVGPVGVVAVRQAVAAAVLLPVARPPLCRMTWTQWWPTLLLALVFGTMNLTLYLAIDRIGLGLAITLEFLGPLTLTLAASRTRPDVVTAILAAAGVYVLVLPGPADDVLGLALGLTAGVCWAAYIVLNRVVGVRLTGLQAPTLASGLCALGYLPVLVTITVAASWDASAVTRAVAAGLLSSVVPYAVDLVTLRTVTPRQFGLLSSAQPAMAALVGLLLLSQPLAVHEWLGIAIVIAANALAVATNATTAPTERAAGQ